MELGENGIKSKTRLDELKQDANEDDEINITGLSSHIKNTCHVIDWENMKIMYGNKIIKLKKLAFLSDIFEYEA